jgi:hypothetical protein
METFLWLAPLVGLLVHWGIGRYNDRKVERDWQVFATLKDERSLASLELASEIDHEMIDLDVEAARKARSSGELQDAARLLRSAKDVIAELTPDRLQRLRAMGVMIRMAMAVTPVEPVPVRPFRRAPLAGLAALGALAHAFLVTPLERFLLRLMVLSLGFRLTLRLLGRSADRGEREPRAERAWRRFEDGAADWKTLDGAHVETARAFLMSLRLAPREQEAAERAR